MIIQYKQYDDRYYNDLKHITTTVFEMTSFNTDRRINLKKAKLIAWKLWCKPVIKSDKKKYCVVAVCNDKAVGYIIYGANVDYSRILNKKIGSIILIAVDKKFQGKYKIADTLLRYVINKYKKYNIDVLTVGTDLENLPAFINYINNGFKPILFWSTYRVYPADEIFKDNKDISVKIVKSVNKESLKHFKRPVSLLLDKRIKSVQMKKLDTYIKRSISKDIKDKKIRLFKIGHKKEIKAYITVVKESAVSSILDKEIYRINDIVFLKNDIDVNRDMLVTFVNFINNGNKDILCLEFFVESNNWGLSEVLEKAGFIKVHNAVTLHKFMQN